MNLKEVLGDAYKEGMAFEEVEAALEKVTVPEDHSAEIERLKNALSKSNSEAAQIVSPHPFCTSTPIQPPPAGRPPLHRADARCTWALERPQTASEAF